MIKYPICDPFCLHSLCFCVLVYNLKIEGADSRPQLHFSSFHFSLRSFNYFLILFYVEFTRLFFQNKNFLCWKILIPSSFKITTNVVSTRSLWFFHSLFRCIVLFYILLRIESRDIFFLSCFLYFYFLYTNFITAKSGPSLGVNFSFSVRFFRFTFIFYLAQMQILNLI